MKIKYDNWKTQVNIHSCQAFAVHSGLEVERLNFASKQVRQNLKGIERNTTKQ
jgi:hypothetical protein